MNNHQPIQPFTSHCPNWTIGPHKCADALPEECVAAQVPGAVQLDWARAHGWGDPFYADNFRQYKWMEDCFWTYRCVLPERPSDVQEAHDLWLHCEGVDYACDVLLEGKVIHRHEGMFTPFSVRLDNYGAKAGQLLDIRIHPAPKSTSSEDPGRFQANRSCKPAVSYEWDWHPRLIPLGLWRKTSLQWRPPTHFNEVSLAPELSADYQQAQVRIEGTYHGGPGGVVNLSLFGPDGERILEEQVSLEQPLVLPACITVEQPQLWWPHDHGEQPLYRMQLSLLDQTGRTTDFVEKTIGFRRIRLIANETNERAPGGPPVTRDYPPMTLEINGRRIFAKGSNWVPPDIFPCRVDGASCAPLVNLAKEAHFNLLRCWGGGLANPESFYDLCDQAGLLVWTEFPLACNAYPDDEDYLNVLHQESVSILKRVRSHPSQAIWCGGNELFNHWSGMDDQSHALRLLARNCYDLDRHTPFLPTSPVYGVAHGYYGIEEPESGCETIQIFQQCHHTAYTEFGMPGPASVETLRTFIPGPDLYPPRRGTAWETHHAFEAWDMNRDSWLSLSILERYTGQHSSIEELVANGQLLQAEGYRHLYEEVRRQKPGASMALNWCFNEPWPCAANNSLVSYPAEPKPAFHAVGESCRPVLASARIPRLLWKPGDTFEAQLWLLNDRHEKLSGTHLQAILAIDEQREMIAEWDCPGIESNTHTEGPACRAPLPSNPAKRTFQLHLISKESPALNTTYTLFFALT